MVIAMNPCACCDETEVVPLVRPRLFNWITIVLVTLWVGIVAVIAENTTPQSQTVSVERFVETLAK